MSMSVPTTLTDATPTLPARTRSDRTPVLATADIRAMATPALTLTSVLLTLTTVSPTLLALT